VEGTPFYRRIYECQASPHVILKNIPIRIVVREITYQTTIHGIKKLLHINSKRL